MWCIGEIKKNDIQNCSVIIEQMPWPTVGCARCQCASGIHRVRLRCFGYWCTSTRLAAAPFVLNLEASLFSFIFCCFTRTRIIIGGMHSLSLSHTHSLTKKNSEGLIFGIHMPGAQRDAFEGAREVGLLLAELLRLLLAEPRGALQRLRRAFQQ